MRILVVEDDRKVAGFLRKGLEVEGYAVDIAPDGVQALVQAHHYDYDCIILDRLLPHRNGIEVLKTLRHEGRTTPVLMLTSLDGSRETVEGLDAGADDYLSKPFDFEELLARIRALLRRRGSGGETSVAHGILRIDRVQHKAWAGTRPIDLTPREFTLLEHFMIAPGRVWRRMELLDKVWDMNFDPESNVVDVHVANLRRKLADATGSQCIATVRGVGYVLPSETA